jgi:hypothetical protein
MPWSVLALLLILALSGCTDSAGDPRTPKPLRPTPTQPPWYDLLPQPRQEPPAYYPAPSRPCQAADRPLIGKLRELIDDRDKNK